MVTEEFNSILKQYEKHKLETYKVLELLGDDYTFNDFGADTENRRYIALLQCGTFLGFDKEQVNNKSCTGTVYHLKSANFCRQRLCPMCQFRKAEKMYINTLRVAEYLQSSFRFLHMVLTIPNARDGVELVNGIKLLYKGFNNLLHQKEVKKAFKGVLRCLEVSYNYDNDTFHPHLHCLVAVNRSYFNDSKVYISHENLRKYWTIAIKKAVESNEDFEVFRSPHQLQCYIRAVKEGSTDDSGYNVGKAIAEVCKYCVKPLELDKKGRDEQYKQLLLTLWHTLKGTRFVQKYGVIREAFRELRLSDDIETEDTGNKSSKYFMWDSSTLKYLEG